jgi:hypothetical protein
LELAAAGALGGVGFVINHSARKLRRQRNTFGLLAWLGRRSRRIQRFQLGFNGRDVGVKQVVQQAAYPVAISTLLNDLNKVDINFAIE